MEQEVDLAEVFGPKTLAALKALMRQVAREEKAGEGDDEWVDVEGIRALTSMTEHAARRFVAELKERSPGDVYQPNGPGTRPLVVRRSALRDLKAA